MRENKSTYTVRTVRFYNPETYPKFVELCRHNCTSGTRVLNQILSKIVESGKLPTEEK